MVLQATPVRPGPSRQRLLGAPRWTLAAPGEMGTARYLEVSLLPAQGLLSTSSQFTPPLPPQIGVYPPLASSAFVLPKPCCPSTGVGHCRPASPKCLDAHFPTEALVTLHGPLHPRHPPCSLVWQAAKPTQGRRPIWRDVCSVQPSPTPVDSASSLMSVCDGVCRGVRP